MTKPELQFHKFDPERLRWIRERMKNQSEDWRYVAHLCFVSWLNLASTVAGFWWLVHDGRLSTGEALSRLFVFLTVAHGVGWLVARWKLRRLARWSIHGTQTGRLDATRPNVANVPQRGEDRPNSPRRPLS